MLAIRATLDLRPRVDAVVLAFSMALLFSGCSGENAASAPERFAEETALPDDDELRRELDEVLDFTYTRRLNTREHAAWQILHGALAYKREFMVENDGQLVSAVNFMLDGGRIRGWDAVVVVDEQNNRRGLRAQLALGSKQGQGHYDQWLAVLAQCDLPPTQQLVVDGQTVTIEDYVRQVQLDMHLNRDREFSWTLIGLTTYLPTNAEWTDALGKHWDIAELVQVEADYDIGEGACGGTHRLIGMTMAVNRHLAQGGKLEGPWKAADDRIQEAIRRARDYQNTDGTLSTNYLLRGGNSPDLAANLGATGHVLEFLTLAMTDEQLNEPWVKRAALSLCQLFRKTKDIPLECGALYHAAHGLVLYRERLFGPRTFGRVERAANSDQVRSNATN